MHEASVGDAVVTLPGDKDAHTAGADPFKHIREINVNCSKLIKNEENMALLWLAQPGVVGKVFSKVSTQPGNDAGESQPIEADVSRVNRIV